MKKTYLVTGGAGFIGSNFVLYMLGKYEDIQIINVDALTYAGNMENLKSVKDDPRHIFIHADICDTEAMTKVFEDYDIDYVVHFAAESHVDRSIKDPMAFSRTNVDGTVNLLAIAREAWSTGEDTYKPCVKFHHVSTDEVYGTLGPEGYFTEETPLDPHSPYSASKASSNHFVAAFADTYKLPTTISCCSNNYGPYQFPEKLIPLVINNALHHESLPVYGDGLQIRDWLYVEDHCKAIDMIVQSDKVGEVYNVGGHNERTNLFIVETIVNYLHDHIDPTITDDLIVHVTDRKGHDRRYAIDPAKIEREIGWAPETMFEEGIVKTIQWYLEHQDWVENVTSGEYQNYYKEMYKGR